MYIVGRSELMMKSAIRLRLLNIAVGKEAVDAAADAHSYNGKIIP